MKRTSPASESFFLPDLCGRQAVAVLVLVAELLAIVLVLARSGFSDSTWADLGTTSLFVQWVALTSAAVLCQVRGHLARVPHNVAAVIAYGIIVLDALLCSVAAHWLYGWILDPGITGATLTVATIAANVLIAAIIGGLIMRYFYVQEQLRRQQEAELQARIQALQSRIRPHFLFNSMNIIASLIATDPHTAEAVVEDLADLFRASLKEAGSEVTLAQELDLCRRYMRIEQLRMGQRLQVVWDTGQTPLNDLRIPLLTLQPLLENAVYHGVQPLPDGGTVTVSIRYEAGVVRIRVDNPVGPDVPVASTHRGNRMALENIRHRLQAMYGAQSGVVSGRDGTSYGTTLHYPFNIDERGPARAPS